MSQTSLKTQASRLCSFFCITLVISLNLHNVHSVNAQPFSQQTTQQDTDQKLSNVKQAISKQKTSIKLTTNKQKSLIKQLKSDDLAIAQVIKSINLTQTKLKTNKKKLEQLNQQQKTLTKQKQQQENILAKQLRAAYSSGHHDYLKLILNQENPADVQRTVTYYKYLNDARIKEINSFQNTIKDLTEVVIEQNQQTKQYQTLQAQQKKQKAKLEKSKNNRQKTIRSLNNQLLNSKQKLKKLEDEEQSLVAALARLAQLSKQEVDLNGLGKLKRKLSWPLKGKISRSFGSSKQGYLRWKGVLMSAPIGRQVKTIHNGTVLFSDWLKGYGLVTVIDHGKGYMSLYGHNQALLKSVGDRVETGEPIALVGQSGGQSKSALYFEIRYNGQAVNPKLWCR